MFIPFLFFVLVVPPTSHPPPSCRHISLLLCHLPRQGLIFIPSRTYTRHPHACVSCRVGGLPYPRKQHQHCISFHRCRRNAELGAKQQHCQEESIPFLIRRQQITHVKYVSMKIGGKGNLRQGGRATVRIIKLLKMKLLLFRLT